MASKSFYRADNVNFIWNKKGKRHVFSGHYIATLMKRGRESNYCFSRPQHNGIYRYYCAGLPLYPTGSAVLVLTTTDVDKTGASYYGEQGLHYLSARGDGNTVPLSKTLNA